MLEHENIDEMTTRFVHIINKLKALGKKYTNAEMVKKILRSLSKTRHSKVIAIQEAKDLNVLSLDSLIGLLKTHEIELNKVSNETTKKRRSIALKSTQKRTQSSKAMKALEESEEDEEDSSDGDDDDDDDDDDEIAHLARKIPKAWIKRKKKIFVPKKDKKDKAK